MSGYGIKAHVQAEPWLDTVRITVTTGAGQHPHVLRIVDGREVWEQFEEMTDPGPTFTLRPEVWDALAETAGHHTQASDATVEALRDTRQVRDRLLTLVERGAS